MDDKIEPRKIAGWEFFDDNVDVCDIVRPDGLQALEPGDREVAERFIDALNGCHKVLDLGCGSGYPGIYVAAHVDKLVGVDAAPNMVSKARANAANLCVENVLFQVGGADGLQFGNEEFDGALLCGVLESMDWKCVHQMMAEVWRVMAPGGRIAVLDQDWQYVLKKKARNTAGIRCEKESLLLQFVERTLYWSEMNAVHWVIARASLWRGPRCGEERSLRLRGTKQSNLLVAIGGLRQS